MTKRTSWLWVLAVASLAIGSEAAIPRGSDPRVLGRLGRYILMTAESVDGESRDLWSTDGTQQGTFRLLSGVDPETGIDGETWQHGGQLVFLAGLRSTPRGGVAFWVTAGTPETTYALSEDRFTLDCSTPYHCWRPWATWNDVAGRWLLTAYSHRYERELLVSDGTARGTHSLGLHERASWIASPGGLGLLNDFAFDAFEVLAWSERDGLRRVLLAEGSPLASQQPWSLAGRIVVMPVARNDSRAEIWSIDLEKALSKRLWVSPIGGPVPLPIGDPNSLVAVRRFLLERPQGRAMLETDGTSGGTLESDNPLRLRRLPAECLWLEIDRSDVCISRPSGGGSAFWRFGPKRVAKLGAFASVEFPPFFARLRGSHALVLLADRTEVGTEPWIIAGTRVGTKLLADLCPGPCSSSLLFLSRWAGEWLLLSTATGELWRTDGYRGPVRLGRFPRSAFVSAFPRRGAVDFLVSQRRTEIWRSLGRTGDLEKRAEIPSSVEWLSFLPEDAEQVLVRFNDPTHGIEPGLLELATGQVRLLRDLVGIKN